MATVTRPVAEIGPFKNEPLTDFTKPENQQAMKAAIEKVAIQQSDGTVIIPRQALRDAMYATTNFKGLTGILSCTPTGDCANPTIGIYEYHKGEYPPTLIFPAPR
jgi:ABC-type branched-subunit amino acid transport system substrate-binding protein